MAEFVNCYSVGYPEAYFARVKLPHDVIIRAIHTIRGDDIYKQTAFFPLPEHRTSALAAQVFANRASLHLQGFCVKDVLLPFADTHRQ